jgi:hypothetical protein
MSRLEEERSTMKRIRLLVLAGVIAVALPFGFTTAGATSTSTKSTTVQIKSTADYDAGGLAVDVGLWVRCYGGSGSVSVSLHQYPPETPYPMSFYSGPQLVVCDGQTHSVAVTLGGFGGDAGRAFAKATLISQGTKTTKASRWITIVQ